MQIKLLTTMSAKIVEWGVSMDGYVAATPIQWELIDTGTVGATLGTAYAQADVVLLDGEALTIGNPLTAMIDGSANTKSAWTATATTTTEGSITATRPIDVQMIAPTNQYVRQFQLGFEPILQAANYLRIRCTAPTAVNASCYIILDI